MVDAKRGDDRKPDPMRVEVMKRLPKEIMEQLTREEVDAFLFEDEWPDALRRKLKDYLVDD
jgi:hypothetical protein